MTTAAAPAPARRRKRLKLAVLLLSPVLAIAVAEVVLRWRAYQLNFDSLESAFVRQPRVAPSGRTRFFDLIRPHENDRIVYDLRPNFSGEYSGAKCTTNSHGFRMPEVEVDAPPGTITIVGLGGSIMFGHGVADGEDFLSVLGGILNERYAQRAWRVINTAVPSHNVVQKVETLKLKGLAFRPQLVVLGIASNNLDLPNYIRVDDDPFDAGRSFLLEFFRERSRAAEENAKRYEVLAAVDKPNLSWNDTVASDPERIPKRFRHLVGWEPFYRALDELKALSQEHGFEVAVVANLEVDLAVPMLAEARKRGFQVISAMEDLRNYVREHFREEFTMERYVKSELIVNPENVHPSALQHKLIASRIAFELWKSGAVDRLVARVPAAPESAGR